MGVQVEDVVLLGAGVQVAELDVVVDVAVVDVRRVVGIERLGRLRRPAARTPAVSAAGRRGSSGPTLAGTSTTMAGSPTAQELRKNSSNLHSAQSHMRADAERGWRGSRRRCRRCRS